MLSHTLPHPSPIFPLNPKKETQTGSPHRPVVVMSPLHYTGGPEALHQLDHALRAAGIESSMQYQGFRDELVRKDFAHRYGCSESSGEVNPDAILIIPETENPRIWRERGWRRIVVWWLAAARFYPLQDYQRCFHIFQSSYAANHRAAEGIVGRMVTDYLRAEHFTPSALRPSCERPNVIACNRRSAAWLVLAVPDLSGVSLEIIEHCTPERVTKILRRARYYLDVGWHPGRDRMPREAAMLGCVVLCGRQGSAGFPDDMPLADELRIHDAQPSSLASCIAQCEQNPERVTVAMDRYRTWITQQKPRFHAEVACFIDDPDGPWHREQTEQIVSPDYDPVPMLNQELRTAREHFSQAGVQALRLGQHKTFSAVLHRLETKLRRWRHR
jgi:hypothetical protein